MRATAAATAGGTGVFRRSAGRLSLFFSLEGVQVADARVCEEGPGICEGSVGKSCDSDALVPRMTVEVVGGAALSGAPELVSLFFLRGVDSRFPWGFTPVVRGGVAGMRLWK